MKTLQPRAVLQSLIPTPAPFQPNIPYKRQGATGDSVREERREIEDW
jgi:hypothetical protein